MAESEELLLLRLPGSVVGLEVEVVVVDDGVDDDGVDVVVVDDGVVDEVVLVPSLLDEACSACCRRRTALMLSPEPV